MAAICIQYVMIAERCGKATLLFKYKVRSNLCKKRGKQKQPAVDRLYIEKMMPYLVTVTVREYTVTAPVKMLMTTSRKDCCVFTV